MGPGAAEGVKAEKVLKSQELKKSPAPASRVRKATEFVKKIEGGVLYTEGGRYSLNGVKVIDSTQEGVVSHPGRNPKKTAEMTFINNQLKEVVIRQRK
jgi:ketopantoate hydroxymethyltransferase